MVGEITHCVVGATGEHEGIDVFGLAVIEDGGGAVGGLAVVGEVEASFDEVDAGHFDGTVVEIGIEDSFDVAEDVAVAFEEVGECDISVTDRGFGGGNGGVKGELGLSAELADEV